MSASLKTISTRTAPVAPPGQQLLSSFAEKDRSDYLAQQSAAGATSQNQDNQHPAAPPESIRPPPPEPQELSPEALAAELKEVSHDLVERVQRLHACIGRLPGSGMSEGEQWGRMRALERELEGLEGERQEAEREKEELLRRIEGGILGVGRNNGGQ